MKKILILLFVLFFGFSIKAQTKIDSFVKKWVGVPYRYSGTDSTGIDCSGLSQKMAIEIYGYPLPRTSKQQMKSVVRIPKDSLKSGDLVFFRSKSSPSGYHVGIYYENGFYLHAASKKLGVILSGLKSRSVLMFGRIKSN